MLSGMARVICSGFLVQEIVENTTTNGAANRSSTLNENNGLRMACLVLNTGKKSEFIFGLVRGDEKINVHFRQRIR